MNRQHLFLSFWIFGSDFCAFAAPKVAVEITSSAEVERYQRLQKPARSREQEARATKIRSRFESKTARRVEISVSPDGRKFLRVTGYLPGIYYRASIHSAADGALLIQLPSPREECGGAFKPQWSPDGKIVSFSEVEGENSLFFDAKTGKKLWTGQREYLYSPRGNTLLMTEYDSKIKHEILVERERKTGKLLRRMPLIPTTYGLVLEFFSPDGKDIYVRGSGGETRTWKIAMR